MNDEKNQPNHPIEEHKRHLNLVKPDLYKQWLNCFIYGQLDHLQGLYAQMGRFH